MQVGDVVLGGGTPFNEVQGGALVDDDQGMFKLSGSGGVQAEIGLKRNVDGNPFGDIDKGSAGPDGAVQGGEFMIRTGNQMHEVGPDHVGIGAMKRAFEIRVNDSLSGHFLTNIVIDNFTVVLCADAGQRVPLGLRNSQTLERFPDFTGKLIPFGRHAGMSGADIGDDVLHMESGDVRSPVGNGKTVILFQAVNAKIPHPVRITLFPGDLKNDVLIESLVYLEVIVLGVPKIVPAVTDFIQIGLLVHIRPLLQAEIALKAVCINLIDERSISLMDNVSFCENVNPVHMEGFENAGGMGDDQQRMFCVFHVSCNPMADGLDRVNIQT